MADSEPKVSEVGAMIPEVYYDIIGRVLPGIIFLWINFKEVFDHILIAFVLAYVVGITVHILSNLVLHWVREIKWVKDFFPGDNKQHAEDNEQQKRRLPNFFFVEDNEQWKWIRRLSNFSDRNVYTKMMGEKIMFRNFFFLGVITVVINKDSLFKNPWAVLGVVLLSSVVY